MGRYKPQIKKLDYYEDAGTPGGGDMLASTYDPAGGAEQVAFASDLGTAAAEDVGYFATAAQGSLADTALQYETDPVFSASAAADITSTDITNLSNLDSAAYEPVSTFEPALPITPADPTVKFLNGNRDWSIINVGAGGYASNLYFTNTDSDVSGYKEISYTNDATEVELTGTITNQEVLLFSGTPAASVTLSETYAHFDFLDIWYEGNNDGGIAGVPYFYTRLSAAIPDIMAVALDLGYLDSGYRIRTSAGIITASGTTVSISGSGINYSTDTTAGNGNVTFSDTQFVPKITRVVGIRW